MRIITSWITISLLLLFAVSESRAQNYASRAQSTMQTGNTQVTIGDVCRLKGQEGNTLHGMGLVVGLSGTGDGDAPTNRSLARLMHLLGNSVGSNLDGSDRTEELKNVKNVALVFVTARIPAQGARQGDAVECRVSSVNAASLRGGYLISTTLVGGEPTDATAIAMAEGTLRIEDPTIPTSAVVQGGCRLMLDLPGQFIRDKHVTLVVDSPHASFSMAQEIEYTINAYPEFKSQGIARAVDAKNVVVAIPEAYLESPVAFVSALQEINLNSVPNRKRVILNSRSGVIAIGEDVEIRRVVVGHKQLTVEVGSAGKFVGVNPDQNTATEKLQSLVDALNTLQVPTEGQIAIIKEINDMGALYGELIVK